MYNKDMDFEERKNKCTEELKATLAKYECGLEVSIVVKATGNLPIINIIDLHKEETKETKEEVK